jgi:hypothetical protein
LTAAKQAEADAKANASQRQTEHSPKVLTAPLPPSPAPAAPQEQPEHPTQVATVESPSGILAREGDGHGPELARSQLKPQSTAPQNATAQLQHSAPAQAPKADLLSKEQKARAMWVIRNRMRYALFSNCTPNIDPTWSDWSLLRLICDDSGYERMPGSLRAQELAALGFKAVSITEHHPMVMGRYSDKYFLITPTGFSALSPQAAARLAPARKDKASFEQAPQPDPSLATAERAQAAKAAIDKGSARLTGSALVGDVSFQFPGDWQISKTKTVTIVSPPGDETRLSDGTKRRNRGIKLLIIPSKQNAKAESPEAVLDGVFAQAIESSRGMKRLGHNILTPIDHHSAAMLGYRDSSAEREIDEFGVMLIVQENAEIVYLRMFCPAAERESGVQLFKAISDSVHVN